MEVRMSPHRQDEESNSFVPKLWREAVERQIDAVRDQVEHLQDQVVEVKHHVEERVAEALKDLEKRIDETSKRVTMIDTNTQEVVGILRDWKGAMRVLKFTAKVIAPLGVIATTISAIFGLLKFFGVL
jgi:methyl-accepting chemotaxis protein